MRAIWDDRAMIQRWLDVEAALAAVEAELGLVPAAPPRGRSRARRGWSCSTCAAMKRDFDVTWNPVMPLVDALRRVLSPAAGALGALGRHQQEHHRHRHARCRSATATRWCWRSWTRSPTSWPRLARRHRDTVMAGRTHGQHALPITFGYKVAVWLDELLRQRERLLESRPRVLVGEFGGAVGTLASLGRKGLRVQKRLMKRLGLGVPTIADQDRGRPLRRVLRAAGHALRHPGQDRAEHLQPAGDGHRTRSTEFVEGKVGSSAMPHKLNPVASGSVVLLGRLLRARAGPVLDYVHSEWEDDHRQGETAWAFAPEVCLLLGAQLVLAQAPARHAWWSSPRTCGATWSAAGAWCCRRR